MDLSSSTFLLTLTAGITAATALIIAALGGLFSEKSGVVNIGIEGMMTFGAFLGGATIGLLEPNLGYWALPIGIILGAIGGGLFGLLHAYLSVTVKADQIIAGTAINMLTLALGLYLCIIIFGSAETPSKIDSAATVLNSRIYWFSVITIASVFVVSFILKKTPWGLRLRACGEFPEAAAATGINVIKMRYIAIIIAGMLAGIGGMALVLLSAGKFAGYTVAGKGFIALAVLIFGRWNPYGILGAGLFFGIMLMIATTFPITHPDSPIPVVCFTILPYVATIIVLIFSPSGSAPEALGRKFNQ